MGDVDWADNRSPAHAMGLDRPRCSECWGIALPSNNVAEHCSRASSTSGLALGSVVVADCCFDRLVARYATLALAIAADAPAHSRGGITSGTPQRRCARHRHRNLDQRLRTGSAVGPRATERAVPRGADKPWTL